MGVDIFAQMDDQRKTRLNLSGETYFSADGQAVTVRRTAKGPQRDGCSKFVIDDNRLLEPENKTTFFVPTEAGYTEDVRIHGDHTLHITTA